jgi:hypothetical protein
MPSKDEMFVVAIKDATIKFARRTNSSVDESVIVRLHAAQLSGFRRRKKLIVSLRMLATLQLHAPLQSLGKLESSIDLGDVLDMSFEREGLNIRGYSKHKRHL